MYSIICSGVDNNLRAGDGVVLLVSSGFVWRLQSDIKEIYFNEDLTGVGFKSGTGFVFSGEYGLAKYDGEKVVPFRKGGSEARGIYISEKVTDGYVVRVDVSKVPAVYGFSRVGGGEVFSYKARAQNFLGVMSGFVFYDVRERSVLRIGLDGGLSI